MKTIEKDHIKSESSQRFMDALLKEHALQEQAGDSAKILAIINKAREGHHLAATGSNRLYLVKFFMSAAALFVVAAGIAVYSLWLKHDKAPGENTVTPFLLVTDGGKVIDAKNSKTHISSAKRLGSEEDIEVASSGSAFVIFPDLTKVEAAPESRLYFKELSPQDKLPAWKKKHATEREISFGNGIFRIDSASGAAVLKTDYGKIASKSSKIILMQNSEMCYIEVCRGSISFTPDGEDGQNLKISAGKCLLVTNGQKPAIMSKNDFRKIENVRNEVNKYKSLLIEDKSYDNILLSLINKNAVDICLNKEFIRNMMRDI